MFELWPVMKRCTVVAKKELLYAGPFGIAAWLCGLVFIDRLNSEASRLAINNSIKNLREKEVLFYSNVRCRFFLYFILYALILLQFLFRLFIFCCSLHEQEVS